MTASEHYLLDRMNPTGYEQVLEQAAGLDASPTRSFVLGLSLILQADGSVLRSLLFDGHGTARGLVDATGRLASGQILAYDAFGVRTDGHSAVLTPIQYTGQWFDEVLGQGYHRHRYLEHGSSRFASFDGYEAKGLLPLAIHKYAYAEANPVTKSDPSGMVSLTEIQTNMVTIMKNFINLTTKLKDIYVRTSNLVDMINAARSLFALASNPSGWLEIARQFIRQNYDATLWSRVTSSSFWERALDSLQSNAAKILWWTIRPEKLVEAQKKLSPKGSAFVMLMPLPPGTQHGMPRAMVRTGIDIGGTIQRPLFLMFGGGSSVSGQLLGLGAMRDPQNRNESESQFFRMDYHRWHYAPGFEGSTRRDLWVWQDRGFHYHIPRISQSGEQR